MDKKRCCTSPQSANDLNKTVEFLKIIAEKNRLKIICLLRKKIHCVCEIWEQLKLPQNLVSHHLKVLKDFGLISSKKEGLNVHYSINKENLDKHTSLLNNYLNHNK